jgi:imidazole glycerol-phosphate synthase subunit HisH
MIAIIKYNAGNILSVAYALERLGYEYNITDQPSEISRADQVILPGVGAAGMAMAYLKEKTMDKIILSLEQPVLGICLGLQLMCTYSEEGSVNCLGIFDTMVRKLPPEDIVPHMGWNNLQHRSGALFKDVADRDDVYFVHSYAADLCDDTTAICDYIQPFSAALNKRNFYATQFHPEKSATVGEQILKNFLSL